MSSKTFPIHHEEQYKHTDKAPVEQPRGRTQHEQPWNHRFRLVSNNEYHRVEIDYTSIKYSPYVHLL